MRTLALGSSGSRVKPALARESDTHSDRRFLGSGSGSGSGSGFRVRVQNRVKVRFRVTPKFRVKVRVRCRVTDRVFTGYQRAGDC